MTLLVAFDTSTTRCAVGVARLSVDGRTEVLSERDVDAPRAANRMLLPLVRQGLAALDMMPADLDVVAVGRGPGSYTGVRIGMAAAKGLAQGLGVGLLGVGSLDAVAWRVAAEGAEGVLGVVGDAMRGEVYPARFRLERGRAVRVDTDTVTRPERLGALWADLPPDMVAGDALGKHAEAVAAAAPGADTLEDEWWRPSARGLIEASASVVPVDPAVLLPAYTNLSDAEARERSPGSSIPESGVAGPVADTGDASEADR